MNIQEKIKEIQEKINSCNNDLMAIELQGQLIDLLKEFLDDKTALFNLIQKNIKK